MSDTITITISLDDWLSLKHAVSIAAEELKNKSFLSNDPQHIFALDEGSKRYRELLAFLEWVASER